MKEYNVGDKLLNIGYLKYIGNKQKWLQINLQPFSSVAGVGECRPWSEIITCFSVQFSNVKEAASIPMHRNKIFDVNTGFDQDRKHERFIGVKQHPEMLKDLIRIAKDEAIAEGNAYTDKCIRRAEQELIALKQQKAEHIAFCDDCERYLLDEL
jgi:hypothetical protein